MSGHIKMQELPESERPYEKFMKYGVSHLSDAELLAVIIKNGTKTHSALDIAKELLKGRQGNLLNLYAYSFDELLERDGIGKVKAIQLKALAELASRITSTSRMSDLQMADASSVADYYMERLRHKEKECLMAAFFNTKCVFLGDEQVSEGTIDYACVSPRDIFKSAMRNNAKHIILLHNHPSGDPLPSKEDIEVTERVCEGGKILGIQVADHIVIGDNRYFSFRENYLI